MRETFEFLREKPPKGDNDPLPEFEMVMDTVAA